MTTARRQASERSGRRSEFKALWMLRLKGYRLLARRFKCPLGEIDLIMRKGQTTAFIEVKARANTDDAVTAVTQFQSRRIVAAAGLWMARDRLSNKGYCRFDIVTVSPYQWPRHIQNAFYGD